MGRHVAGRGMCRLTSPMNEVDYSPPRLVYFTSPNAFKVIDIYLEIISRILRGKIMNISPTSGLLMALGTVIDRGRGQQDLSIVPH